MFVIDQTNYRVIKGGLVTVYGVGFNSDCVVRVDGAATSVTDYADDFISFYAPEFVGSHTFAISDGTSSATGLALYVADYSNANTYRLPNRGESSFRRMLDGLLPRGFAWKFEQTSNWSKLLSGIALSFVYMYGMLKDLVLEMSPATTTSLGLWENDLGLPHKGVVQSGDSAKKSEIMRIARKKGGATVPYINSVLSRFGVSYELYEYCRTPEAFPDWVGALGEEANYYVLVKIFTQTVVSGFKCTSKCNASLRKTRNSVLESILAQEKPAHTKFIYSYVIPA